MRISEAVERRMSVRAFRPDPVPDEVVRDILLRAARAPSGGNLQPWRVHALTGAPLQELLALAKKGMDPAPGHAVYPADLWEPYRTRRFANAEQLYASISIPREDKMGRLKQLAKNAELFGAPVGLFVLIDRKMGEAQWTDLGIFLQTVMLLAVERGLDTCAQGYWSMHAATVERFLGAPEDQMLVCGMALGYRDESAPINTMRTDRAPQDEWLSLKGF